MKPKKESSVSQQQTFHHDDSWLNNQQKIRQVCSQIASQQVELESELKDIQDIEIGLGLRKNNVKQNSLSEAFSLLVDTVTRGVQHQQRKTTQVDGEKVRLAESFDVNYVINSILRIHNLLQAVNEIFDINKQEQILTEAREAHEDAKKYLDDFSSSLGC